MTASSMDELYHPLFSAVAEIGSQMSPRDKKCIEVRPACLTITNPLDALYTGESRRLNYRFFAIETLLYIAADIDGKDHSYLIQEANPAIGFAANPYTAQFDGWYGAALAESLEAVEAMLIKDIWTRQAVASIWSPLTTAKLALEGSRDVPCTCLLHFFAEQVSTSVGLQTKLSMNVYMRSNDLNWGTPYDVAAFATIQCMMARVVGLQVGAYNHFAGSLHFYEEGGSDGERPPTITNQLHEKWIANKTLQVPAGPDCTLYHTRKAAGRLVKALIEHRSQRRGNGKWADFAWTGYDGNHSASQYMFKFVDLIKFQHSPKPKQAWKDDVS